MSTSTRSPVSTTTSSGANASAGPPPAPAPSGDLPAPRPQRRARPSFTTLKTTMAITGTIMGLFVLVHMIGNLKAFQGPDTYNHYAEWLREIGYPLIPHEGVLWILRLVLGTCLILHVASGFTLWSRGRRARGPFRRKRMRPRTFGARTMVLTGSLMLVFIIVHLLDLTIGRLVAPGGFLAATHSDGQMTAYAYENLVASLSRPPMAIFYSLVMLTIGVHLAQGLWSVVNDLGGTGGRLRRICLVIAIAVALAIAIGNGMLPLLVLSGVIS
ncbi:succinate dehydrogenase cytochrome b subunit [Actinomyces sp. MRS3W]|uniref:succinate dehydrogenase cytochrome b subunit n=1 Tax=Actinomyces sp. MRS3W TaxID=2800796 RepID=UPI0028FD2932|nr:succinate dehydrogenase cytochrome b subunit [Actinomyces sp. MRS3W]MDU0349000.1 succinate dehydrogenase cytochrome b subunit [Actinomyces sp. MRS3W]